MNAGPPANVEYNVEMRLPQRGLIITSPKRELRSKVNENRNQKKNEPLSDDSDDRLIFIIPLVTCDSSTYSLLLLCNAVA